MVLLLHFQTFCRIPEGLLLLFPLLIFLSRVTNINVGHDKCSISRFAWHRGIVWKKKRCVVLAKCGMVHHNIAPYRTTTTS
jgi:hypothetical protein